MSYIRIKNALVVNENSKFKADILIQDEIILDIYHHPISNENLHFIDRLNPCTIEAEGLHLFPGIIDDQVHFREPGLTHKADIYSESIAAAAGGVTSYMEMPNTNPQATDLATLSLKQEIAANNSIANYSFYLGATNNNLDIIKKVNPQEVCGVKVFMGSSTGNMLVDNNKTLEGIFAESPILIATHCEDESIINKNTEIAIKEFGENIPINQHPIIRNAEACYRSSSLAAELASKYGSKLHILHLSSNKEMSIFDNGLPQEKKITAEVCVHHLWFTDADYATHGNLIKCNPAIKTENDRNALIQALIENKIDIIATDHAPHTQEEKNNTYLKAPSGIPLVQHSLQLMLEHFHKGTFTLESIIYKMCHAPAIIYQINKRGFIRKGYYADLTLVDLNKPYTVTKENILYKCKWSPFENTCFKSSIITTLINGKIVFANNQISTNHKGKMLKFNR